MNISVVVCTYNRSACLKPMLQSLRESMVPAHLSWELILVDYGDAVTCMDSPDLWGANFAVRSAMFKKYGLFDSNLGRIPQKLYVGEETEFLQRLLNGGEKLLYAPWPVIYHRVPAHRMSK